MKKMNNKGFSLVELIVVIAIMAILAVTLAPRLVQYVDRARVASDQEAVNTIFTAAKLANLEEPLGVTATPIVLGADADALYIINDREWKLNPAFPVADSDGEDFWNTMKDILGDFELKANQADENSLITLEVDTDGKLTVILNYTGTDTDPYTLAE